MKVKLAAQLLSNSVYAVMKTMIDLHQLPKDHEPTANFCKMANDLFDLFNISQKDDANPLKCGSKIFTNLYRFNDFYDWVNTLKYCGSYTPTVKGLKITIKGMINLVETLQSKQYKWICTRRFQSDGSEHIFSLVKMKSGGNPTAIRFKYAFKSMFVSTLLRNPLGSNVEVEEDDYVAVNEERLDFLLMLSRQKKTTPVVEEDSDSEFESGGEDSNDDDRINFELNQLCADLKELEGTSTSECVAIYGAGWAVKKILSRVDCQTCHEMLEFHTDRDEPGLDKDETLMHNKSFEEADPFLRRSPLSYGHLLKSEVKNVFHEINQHFGQSFYTSLNLVGTNFSVQEFGEEVERNTTCQRFFGGKC